MNPFKLNTFSLISTYSNVCAPFNISCCPSTADLINISHGFIFSYMQFVDLQYVKINLVTIKSLDRLDLCADDSGQLGCTEAAGGVLVLSQHLKVVGFLFISQGADSIQMCEVSLQLNSGL